MQYLGQTIKFFKVLLIKVIRYFSMAYVCPSGTLLMPGEDGRANWSQCVSLYLSLG
jgi:hypothetical protein